MDRYMIVRYFRDPNRRPQIRERGLTLEEAQAHCSDPKTSKAGVWFDGYTKQDSLRGLRKVT